MDNWEQAMLEKLQNTCSWSLYTPEPYTVWKDISIKTILHVQYALYRYAMTTPATLEHDKVA